MADNTRMEMEKGKQYKMNTGILTRIGIGLFTIGLLGLTIFTFFLDGNPEWCKELPECRQECMKNTNWTTHCNPNSWNDNVESYVDNCKQHHCFDECGGNSCY